MGGREVYQVDQGEPRQGKGGVDSGAARSVEDARAALGEEALTARQRMLIADLLRENDRLTDELAAAQRRNEVLERLVVEDPLVPVLNRRGFMRELERAISYVARHGTPAALIFIDLNRFKLVNDRYGHAAGDAALRHCGTILRDSIRASDTIGRLGGDEFAIILWNADPGDAAVRVGELAALIEKQPLESEHGPIMVSASAGAAAILGSDTPEAVLQRADQDMFTHKSTARPSG